MASSSGDKAAAVSSTAVRPPPALPWKVKLFVKLMSFAVDLSCRPDGTVNRRVMSLFDIKSRPRRSKRVSSTDVTVDPSRNLWLRLYTPTFSTAKPLPLIFFFHGGGFAFLAPDSKPYDDSCRRLAAEIPAVVISVNYRLAPEHRCPCQYEDGLDVLKFIDGGKCNEVARLCQVAGTVELKRSFVAGDSAGGNLAHHVAMRGGSHKFSSLDLIGNISIQPFFGGEERTASELELADAPFSTWKRTDIMWKLFMPVGSDRDHPAVNVFGPNGEDVSSVKFPPTVVFVGGYDPLKDWQRRYCEGLKRAGKEARVVEYENAIHTFYAYPEVPESDRFVEEVRNFVRDPIGFCSADQQ
ncbi:unnamed protein product [Linum tenue]|uniref:Alpha/beta hydrolase fold-3 domain-containing protein n=1 Tax=Linum tenue TaxID=586396 RepID=A0AAV0RE75_9ROSI|nr:unnamed protein product [Linum tenue]